MKNPFRAKTAADIAAEIARVEASAHDREHAVREAETALKSAIVDGDASAIVKAETAVSEARKAVEHAGIRLEGLRERHADLKASEDLDNRRRIYDAAVRDNAKDLKELETIYRHTGAETNRALAIAAKAARRTEHANANLPDGAEPLVDPDTSLRVIPGLPEEIVSERTAEVWCHLGSWRRIPEGTPVSVHAHNPNLGIAQRPGAPSHDVERRAFRIVRFRPAVRHEYAEPLETALRIPALASDQPAPQRAVEERWEPIRDTAADAA